MAELDSGISLFKMAGRDETVSFLGLCIVSCTDDRCNWNGWQSWVERQSDLVLAGRTMIQKTWIFFPLVRLYIARIRRKRISSGRHQSARIISLLSPMPALLVHQLRSG
jgi:hypothetical protein